MTHSIEYSTELATVNNTNSHYRLERGIKIRGPNIVKPR